MFLASDRSVGMTGTFTNVTQMFPSYRALRPRFRRRVSAVWAISPLTA